MVMNKSIFICGNELDKGAKEGTKHAALYANFSFSPSINLFLYFNYRFLLQLLWNELT